MRKWKIRTKMIAGLSLLALVVGLLIYSSYSQLARDRGLATEISQLADEIVIAHEVNEWADKLLQDHSRFTPPSDADAMIEADRILDFARLEESIEQKAEDISWSLFHLDGALKEYRTTISGHVSTRKVTNLLIDRSRQSASLDEIDALLKSVEDDWKTVSGLEYEKISADYRNHQLGKRVETLVDLTLSHFKSIQEGMRAFGDNVRSEQRSKQNAFLSYTGAAVFLIALLAWQFWSLIVVPFQTLLRGSELIADGHKNHRIELGTNDEISRMADTVNDITAGFNQAVAEVTQAKLHAEQEVRDRTREVIQNEQLASTGFLAAGVAHEINNPLGIIAWTAEALEGSLEDLSDDQRALIFPEFLSELTTSLSDIQNEAFRCKGITERLLHFSRLGDSSRDMEDLGELAKSVISMVGKVGEYRCKTLTAHCDDNVLAHCNAQEIQQVVLNLVSNALESVATDGSVDVYVRLEPDPLSGIEHACVIVEDDGCGMDQQVMDHLFEPFFTRRQDNTGTGLGLSISYRIVSLHHGSLTPFSEGAGRGSRMTLRLPAEAPQDTNVPIASERAPVASDQSESELLEQWKHVQKAA